MARPGLIHIKQSNLGCARIGFHTRRMDMTVGAAAGVAGAYYAAPSCVQVVDAYGRVTTRC